MTLFARKTACGALAGAALGLLAALGRAGAAPTETTIALPAAVPAASQAVGRLPAARPVSLALTLPLRNGAALQDLLRRQYDPQDALYGHYLTPDQFAARFSPTPADYNRVLAFARAHGLTVTGTHPNRTIVDVQAPAATVEATFGVHMLSYRSATDGRLFYAPDAHPRVPASLAGIVSGVVGLNTAALPHPNLQQWQPRAAAPLQAWELPSQIGSGPGSALTPSDIKAAYNLSGVTQTGSGQTLGLVELDGYTASDITSYESYYNLPNVTVTPVLVNSFDGNPSGGNGSAEVTLDIELQIALAPGASQVLVYESDNSSQSLLNIYSRIATDNLAKNISSSWGIWEDEFDGDTSFQSAEASSLQQLASQGQSFYAATGDHGAYDPNSNAVSAQDPATQPYTCAVGGTTLAVQSAGGHWQSETTWNDGSSSAGAGGGGISDFWTIPSYQSGVVSTASQGSTTMRNEPDVSLDSDTNTGYSIYFNSGWYIFGGTSCAAPLWAAFNALVNQQRAANGSALLGFPNPTIYTLAQSGSYGTDFHDIADNSTNLVYPAVTGYDDATGWGTFNGANLLTDLAGGSGPVTPPSTTASLSGPSTNGFYTGGVTVTLSATAGSAPVTSTLYRVDNGTQQTYTGPFTVSSDGAHTVTFHSQDTQGSVESAHNVTFKIDTTAPVTTDTVTSASTGDKITLSATDAVSGIATRYYALNGGTAQAYTGSFTVSKNASYTLTFYSVDKAGNTEATKSASFTVNVALPVTTAALTGTQGTKGYYTSAVTVTLKTTAGGLPVKARVYQLDGGTPQTYTTFSVSGDTRHTLTFYATDTAGNTEAAKTVTVLIDAIKPVTTATLAQTTTGEKITLTRTDDYSGIANTFYTVDGGAQKTYATTFAVPGTGAHTVTFHSADHAGNVETTKTLKYTR